MSKGDCFGNLPMKDVGKQRDGTHVLKHAPTGSGAMMSSNRGFMCLPACCESQGDARIKSVIFPTRMSH